MPRSTPAASTAIAVLALLPSSALAAPVTVQAGSLDWNQANVYNAAPERTFLGHTTNPGLVQQGRSNGTALTTGGATTIAPDGGAVDGVRPDSPRGTGQSFTFRFPAASGTFDRAARTLDLTATGTLTYVQYPALASPPAPIVVSGLRLTLSGTTGAVYAATSGPAGAADYPGDALFTLNAAQAQFTPLGGGRYLIGNLVPTLAKAGVFGTAQQYAPGTSGPDRTPNTWGGFSVVVDTERAEAPAPTVIERERIVERIVDRQVGQASVVLARTVSRRPFATSAAVEFTLRKAGTKPVIGEGVAVGRRLWIVVPSGTTLTGKYVLDRTSAGKRLAKSAAVTFAQAAGQGARR